MPEKRQPLDILLVEDDAQAAELRAQLFEAQGCRVMVAHDLGEARERVESAVPIDLVVTDIKLGPGRDDRGGVQLARLSRELRPATPVVGYSAYYQEADLEPTNALPFDRMDFKGELRAADFDAWMRDLMELATTARDL
jgi:CheY-like chemotaxis protein